MRTRIKICGITRVEDGLEAARLGADAIGLVFYEPSPRAVSIAHAREIAVRLPAFVTIVGLFVDPAPEQVEAVLARVPLDLLQFHGEESPADCARYARPYIKAVRMREATNLTGLREEYAGARGFLLDSYKAGVAGGTGETFDWARVPDTVRESIILAGGLTPENAGQAVRQLRPYAVDVSSGVESRHGIKDHQKLAAFIQAVQTADQSLRMQKG